MPNEVRLTRKELYKRVWAQSMRTLAKEFKLSDVGLAKICKKYNIPRPGPGYWTKQEYGKPVDQTALPNPKDNPVITIDVSGRHRTMMDRHAYSAAKVKEIDACFTVPDILKNPHSLVVKTKEVLKNDPHAYYSTPDILDINVSRHHQARAFRIMDTFIKIMEKRGHQVKIDHRSHYERSPRTSVVVQGNDIHIKIYDNPDSNLTFGFDGYMEGRKNWSDGKNQRVEDMLYSIVLKILLVARQRLHRSIHWRIERRKREELERIQAEQEEQRHQEQERIQHLEMEVENWRKSRHIREYLSAVVNYVNQKHGGYDEGSQFDLWLKWANRYANKIDPLTDQS